jgi:hypothetical protein
LPHARIVRGELSNPQILPADIDLVLTKGEVGANKDLEAGDVLFVPQTRISNWNSFLQDVRPTIDLATLPLRGFAAAFLRNPQKVTTTTTTIIVVPTPPVPLP